MRRRWSLKSRERMGSVLFEKMKCLFSVAPVEKLEKSREKHSPDAGPEAPDAVPVGPVCRQSDSVRVRHRTQGGASGGVSPVP